MDIKLKSPKDKHIKGSIFLILIRKYIFFTLAIIICGLLLFYLAQSHMRGIISEPLYQKLISYNKCLLFDEYQDIPVENLLGKGSLIQVLNEKNEIIYDSKGNIAPSSYTEGELDCIPLYNEYRYAEITNVTLGGIKNNNTQKILMISHMNSDKSECYLLNSKNQLLNGAYLNGRNHFTDKELGYFTGTYPGNVWIQKYEFRNKEGEYRTMLLCLPVLSEHEYRRAYQEVRFFYITFFVFYIILIILFVMILNHQFKKPIRLLNRALLNFAEGKREGEIEYTGPVEFVKICNSFNIMSKRLLESEVDNKRLEIEKNKMLADISHDLKTPATVIQGYSKALSDGLITEANQKQYLDIIYKKSLSIGELINKFYEYSKLEHPDFHFQFITLDACEISREYLADRFEELQIGGYSLDVRIPDNPILIKADRMQLRRVIENLLANTVSHTPSGTDILFEIRQEDDKVIVEYSDNGGGIGKDIAKYIFEPFIVEDSSRNKNGSGLGLSIVKKIVNGHNGTVELVDTGDNGVSMFRIVLPVINE